ncbi:MAG: SDR family NAD(P)-dependent oxidoreductase [Bryobacteraceae bacterium]
MNVLVLGSTSVIGMHLAAAFASGNNLLLTGRNPVRLSDAAGHCREAGACSVVEFPCDLGADCSELLVTTAGWNPDVIINAASATSQLRDDAIAFDDFSSVVRVDLLAPLDLLHSLVARRNGQPLRVVFVSSALAAVRSPRRAIYGSLKRVHEQALVSLSKKRPEVQVLIARLSKVISPRQSSREALRFAATVRDSFDRGRTYMSFGWSGRLVTGLFFVQPLAFYLVVDLARAARRWGRKMGRDR